MERLGRRPEQENPSFGEIFWEGIQPEVQHLLGREHPEITIIGKRKGRPLALTISGTNPDVKITLSAGGLPPETKNQDLIIIPHPYSPVSILEALKLAEILVGPRSQALKEEGLLVISAPGWAENLTSQALKLARIHPLNRKTLGSGPWGIDIIFISRKAPVCSPANSSLCKNLIPA